MDSTSHTDPPPVARSSIGSTVYDFYRAFVDLLHLPRAFWVINLAFMLDSMAYFGMLTLMTSYLPADVGFSDAWAGLFVSFFTGFVTLFMLGVGGIAETLGVRRGLILALALCLIGRVLVTGSPLVAGSAPLIAIVAIGLIVIAMGEGILQPLSYAGIKAYTDERTNAMGYGLIYAVMNLGIVLIAWISPLVRVPVQENIEAASTRTALPHPRWSFVSEQVNSGYMAVYFVCVFVALVALLAFVAFMTRRAEAHRIRAIEPKSKTEGRALLPRFIAYFTEGPFRNIRFVFFVCMLFPVQTLFAHQWLTMPPYVLRAYPEDVADKMEWIVSWINSGIIVLGVPIATALTRRANVYTMMIIGTTVSALPTFLLSIEPRLELLVAYLVLFSIGEALWQPRFLQYAAELAPPGRVAQYMGLANVPWVTAKMTTGLYSGRILETYCPEGGPFRTEAMWLLYAFIAVSTPIGLLLARRWVMQGERKHPTA